MAVLCVPSVNVLAGSLPASGVDGQDVRRAERRRRLLEAGKGAARSGAGTEGPDAAMKRASMPPPEGNLLLFVSSLRLAINAWR